MKAPSKTLRKKELEPLDWRSLADGPALRGLTDVLSNPPTVGDTISVGESNTVDETLSVGITTSVVVNTSVGIWADEEGNTFGPRRVTKVLKANQSMSLGEERVYRALWEASSDDGIVPIDDQTKTFTLGYDRLARLVRLNEKSVRLLIPKMVEKKMLEITAPERSADRMGRTYKIFGESEILRRQREVGLEFVAKRGRAVEFVKALLPR